MPPAAGYVCPCCTVQHGRVRWRGRRCGPDHRNRNAKHRGSSRAAGRWNLFSPP